MDTKNTKPSRNFSDRTGDNEVQRFLNYMLVMLNPVYAYRKSKNPDGAIPAAEGVDLRKGPNTNSFLNNGLLQQIMREDDLVDPNVAMSGKYGDLIPKSRWDRLGK